LLDRCQRLRESPFPPPVADVVPNTDLQNNRFSPVDSALGELAKEVHQNTANCFARISAGCNEFGSASKRNTAQTVWQQPDCGSSGHDPGDGMMILCKWIEWISGINKAGAAHSEQSLHLTDRFGDNDVGLAGLKLVL
jgi:hypothetical protein